MSPNKYNSFLKIQNTATPIQLPSFLPLILIAETAYLQACRSMDVTLLTNLCQANASKAKGFTIPLFSTLQKTNGSKCITLVNNSYFYLIMKINSWQTPLSIRDCFIIMCFGLSLIYSNEAII